MKFETDSQDYIYSSSIAVHYLCSMILDYISCVTVRFINIHQTDLWYSTHQYWGQLRSHNDTSLL